MPELPEVETYRRYLEETSLHQTLTHLYVEDTKLLTTDETTLRQALIGKQFTGTRRVGKNLFVLLDAPYVLHMHFGMTGSLEYFRDVEDTPRFARIIFSFASGFRLAFVCPRKFERIGLVEDIEQHLLKKKIARDGLEITEHELALTIKRRNALIKPVLMNQATVAGLGNWIVDEVLFQAGVHPEKISSQLSDTQISRIHAAIQLVLRTAIAEEAIYRRFPRSFLIHARAWDVSPYENADQHRNCPRCQGAIHVSTVGGRTTYFCETCQSV